MNTAELTATRVLREINLDGMRLHVVTQSECIEFILDELEQQRGGWVVTANLDFLRRYKHEGFAELYDQSTLRVADGTTLVWGGRLRGTPLPERVAGSDLIVGLTKSAADRGRSIFLLGGDPGTAEAAAQRLQIQSPTLQIAGIECPPIGFHSDPASMQWLSQRLARARPDIVYVGLGSPKQEAVIAQLRTTAPHAWWIGVGISFSFLCGRVKRAPIWVRRIGMEWFFRVTQEPRRLSYRFLAQGVPFGISFMTRSALHGLVRKR